MKTMPVYFQDEEKELIQTASRLVGLQNSSFIKQYALREARKIIKENREVSQ
jgi:uncharacterized protein (DUF1778 family)